MRVGTIRMAAQALIFFTWSFWLTLTRVRFTLRMFCSELPKGVGLICNAQQTVLNGAQIAAHLQVDVVRLLLDETLQRPGQRLRGLVELDHLAGELVDSPGDVGMVLEDLDLDLVDVVREAVDHRDIVVHDAVHDRVEDRVRPLAEQFRPALEPPAHLYQLVRLAVRTVTMKSDPTKAWTSPNSTIFVLLDVAGGLDHHEERLAVALDLGPQMRLMSSSTASACNPNSPATVSNSSLVGS